MQKKRGKIAKQNSVYIVWNSREIQNQLREKKEEERKRGDSVIWCAKG